MLIVLVLLAALFPLVLFPASGIGDDKPLDLYFSYSSDQVHEYLGRLGADGRAAYATMELTIDLLFPIVYSLALAVSLVIAARRVLPADSRLQYLRFFPLLIVIADWCENLGLVVAIQAFPVQLDTVSTTASYFTSLKWGFIAFTVMMLFTVGAWAIATRFRNW